MVIQESGEMYLETILILSKQKEHVRAVDICEYMHFSKPSVSRALSLLKDLRLVNSDKNGFLELSQEGRSIATKIYERHTILTNVLIKLGVNEEIASKDACKIEHIISEDSFQAIKNSLS